MSNLVMLVNDKIKNTYWNFILKNILIVLLIPAFYLIFLNFLYHYTSSTYYFSLGLMYIIYVSCLLTSSNSLKKITFLKIGFFSAILIFLGYSMFKGIYQHYFSQTELIDIWATSSFLICTLFLIFMLTWQFYAFKKKIFTLKTMLLEHQAINDSNRLDRAILNKIRQLRKKSILSNQQNYFLGLGSVLVIVSSILLSLFLFPDNSWLARIFAGGLLAIGLYFFDAFLATTCGEIQFFHAIRLIEREQNLQIKAF